MENLIDRACEREKSVGGRGLRRSSGNEARNPSKIELRDSTRWREWRL